MKRVSKICSREAITVENLAENISFYMEKYGQIGNDSALGKISNNTLRKFGEFVASSN